MDIQEGRGQESGWATRAARLFLPCSLMLAGSGWLPGEPLNTRTEERQKYEEYETRAAFLLVFAKYTEWPQHRLGPSDAFVVGVLGDSPLGRALEKQAANMTLNGRKVLVKRFHSGTEVDACHLLYFSASAERQLPDLRRRLAAEGVLTVGETNFFMGFGGGVHLFREEGSLQFVLNRAVLEQSHLRVASRVLNLAKKILNEP